MQLYISSIALILIGSIMIITVGDRGKEFTVLLSLCACCAACLSAVHFLEPIMELIEQLKEMAGLESNVLTVLLKISGIALISELVALICSDVGQTALGKITQLLSGIAIVWISIPLVERLIALLVEVLG